jgi:hypothetical protein
MTDFDFTNEEILEQARGDSAAIWHLAARWARERDGSVDAWASFVGGEFAPTWDGFGDNASALEVARQVALIMAGQADMRPAALSGDASSAELVVEGPDPEYLEVSATTTPEIDRTHELVFRAIAERRGMTLECRRDDAGLHLVLARS